MENPESAAPRHNVTDSHFDSSESTIIVMCYGKRFTVHVKSEDLQGTIFAVQYNELLQPLEDDDDDDDAYEMMCDWFLQPCLPLLRDIAVQAPLHLELTLEDFFPPQTFGLTSLSEKEWTLAKRVDLLPPFPNVPRIAASTVTIVSDESDNCGCEVPRKVRTDDGTQFYLKPAFDESQYIREVQATTRIAHTVRSDLRVSKLVGIVTSDDLEMTIGLLLEWIPSLGDLQSSELSRQKEIHEQWKDQITATVKELHKHGITWGDVHPGNIIIDRQMNAWIIDFGRGWVEPFVTRRTFDTVEGDLQGIMNVFEHLGSEEVCDTKSGEDEVISHENDVSFAFEDA